MYPNSSQKKHWTFKSQEELFELRAKANQEFISIHGAKLSVSLFYLDLFTLIN